jgi:hypothetical protein
MQHDDFKKLKRQAEILEELDRQRSKPSELELYAERQAAEREGRMYRAPGPEGIPAKETAEQKLARANRGTIESRHVETPITADELKTVGETPNSFGTLRAERRLEIANRINANRRRSV